MSQVIMETVYITEWFKALSKKKTWYYSGNMSFPGGRSVAFKMWDRGKEDKEPPLPEKGFYNVTGSYDDRQQFIIKNFTLYTGDTSELNFSAAPPFVINIELLNQEFCNFIESIKTEWLRNLVTACIYTIDYTRDGFYIPSQVGNCGVDKLRDDDFNKNMKYRSMWAATYYHHAYRHGWLIHTLEVVRIAVGFFDSMTAPYGINENAFGSIKDQRDILIAAAILHDIGKGVENKTDGIVYEKTPFGKFSENDLDITVDFVQQVFHGLSFNESQDFSRHMWVHLIKALRGHHGKYGNQKPVTFVAQCLCAADGSSSHMAKIRKAFLEGDEMPRIRKDGSNDTYFSYAAKVV